MKKLDEIHSFYNSELERAAQSLQKYKSLIYRIGTLRLLLFVAGVVALILFWNSGWVALTVAIACTFLPFLGLVKYHNSLFYRKEYAEKKRMVNAQELAALEGDYSHFADGFEYLDSQHLFSYDLDLFGPKSLFQYVNRTTTSLGTRCLAEWLSKPLLHSAQILHRQEAVRELSSDPLFGQELRVAGLLSGSASSDFEELRDWTAQPAVFLSSAFFRCLPFLAAGTNAVLWALAVAGVIPYSVAGLVFVLFIVLSITFSKGVTKAQTSFDKKWKILRTYVRMLQLIEAREMQSSELQILQQQLRAEGVNASVALQQLSSYLNALDQRNNILITALLNGLFFWELRQTMRIEKWKQKHADLLLRWLGEVGKMEALASMATSAFNNPDYTYPTATDEPFLFEAKELGHPLMSRECCVKNDISMSRRPFFIIVTGANMAGKSTYLRTVGVNYVLACAGMPVCATQMRFYPAQLITSLRTSDSLSENESYFFAELKRLSMILERLKNGEILFVILDEILRGTNSVDKQKGSMALVRQFIQLGANGILATHDLKLATLRDTFPPQIDNFCFEATISGDELTFNYKMQEGIAQNMNACFLMQKMGFEV